MRTSQTVLFAAIVWLHFSGAINEGHAQTNMNPAVREDLNNLSSDLQQCFIYNTVGAQCFGDKDPSLKARIQVIADEQNNLSISIGRMAGVSDKAILARTEMFMREIKDDMDNDCINISVILNKHALKCKVLMEGFQHRLDVIMSKMNKR